MTASALRAEGGVDQTIAQDEGAETASPGLDSLAVLPRHVAGFHRGGGALQLDGTRGLDDVIERVAAASRTRTARSM